MLTLKLDIQETLVIDTGRGLARVKLQYKTGRRASVSIETPEGWQVYRRKAEGADLPPEPIPLRRRVARAVEEAARRK